jgi:DNA-binding response OmpR family regulator
VILAETYPKIERPVEAPAEVKRPSVLLIEDDVFSLETLAAALREAGLSVCACKGLSEVLQGRDLPAFDLVLVDWIVEGVYADEVLRSVRAILRPRPLPMVWVLSCLDDNAMRVCLRTGAPVDRMITRPVGRAHFADWAPRFAAMLKGVGSWKSH